MTTNTGDCNTGHRNTGNHNTGDWNTGDHNTGYRNTGNHNTGDCNTGHCNTGYRNTGHRNTGNHNTGDWNTGDCNTANNHVGCFNTVDAEKAYYFNKLIDKSEWDAAEKPRWIYRVSPTTWVNSSDMSEEEKQANPSHETTGGYLRVNDFKAEWAKAFANATPEDIELTKALPVFDADVFLEITGVDLREKPVAPCEGREVEIEELEQRLNDIAADNTNLRSENMGLKAKLAQAETLISDVKRGPTWGSSIPSWSSAMMLKASIILAELTGEK